MNGRVSRFDSDGLAIAYEVAGDGPPVVLVHGFASDRKRNWGNARWFETLINAGRRIVALDCRGHGDSDKPHNPAAYTADLMSGDVVRLLDHLGIARADLMGYSMGGRIAAVLLVRHAERFGCAVLGGVGAGLVDERHGAEAIARALEADDAAGITDLTGQAFRTFAEDGRNDLRALAACMRGMHHSVDASDLDMIATPLLVVVGENDTLVGDPQRLVARIAGAELVTIPKRDHLSTVADRRYKEAALRFFAAHGVGLGAY